MQPVSHKSVGSIRVIQHRVHPEQTTTRNTPRPVGQRHRRGHGYLLTPRVMLYKFLYKPFTILFLFLFPFLLELPVELLTVFLERCTRREGGAVHGYLYEHLLEGPLLEEEGQGYHRPMEKT